MFKQTMTSNDKQTSKQTNKQASKQTSSTKYDIKLFEQQLLCCRGKSLQTTRLHRGVFYADAGGDVLSQRTPTVFADPRGTRAFRYAGQGQRLEPTAPFHRLVSWVKGEVLLKEVTIGDFIF